MFKGKKYISPKLGVSGILLESGRWWSPKGEKKISTNTNLKYHISGTGSKWHKIMLQRRGKELEDDIQNFIKNGGI